MTLPDFRNQLGEKFDVAFHPGTRTGVLVLLAHGLTGNKERPLLLALASGLSELGWPCLRFSYPGNGDSEGKFVDATISKESQDLQDLIAQIPADVKIAYVGHSMGGAVGVKTTAEEPRIKVLVTLAGMIRPAAFYQREFANLTPGKDLMWEEPGCLLSKQMAEDLKETHDLFDEVSRISVPYLLAHGTADDVILPEDSRDAYDTAEEPKRLVELPEADHSFTEKEYPILVREIDSWLGQYL
jgi:uncharacterized protein